MKTQRRELPVIGVVFVCMFAADAMLFGGEALFEAIGGVVYHMYRLISTIWKLLHLFPGIVLFPVLLVIFCVQAIRLRKNRRYLKHWFCSVFACVLLALLGGILKTWLAPWAADGILGMKLRLYEAAVEEVHAGRERDDCLTGGVTGQEDVAFFQYRAYYKRWDNKNNVSTTCDMYLLYSQDDQCDLENLLLPEHHIYHTELQPIRENWYEMTVENDFYP